MRVSLSERNLKKHRKERKKTSRKVMKEGGTCCSNCERYFSYEDSKEFLIKNFKKGEYKRFLLRCPNCLRILGTKKGSFWNRLEKEDPIFLEEVRKYLKLNGGK